MLTPEDYFLDALEMVSAWDLTDDTAVVAAANAQARLMAGCFDHDEVIEITLPTDTFTDH